MTLKIVIVEGYSCQEVVVESLVKMRRHGDELFSLAEIYFVVVILS